MASRLARGLWEVKPRRFFAFLTILSVTFTQISPAWARSIQELDAGNGAASSSRSRAMRTESGGSPTVRAGLEENLRGGAGDDPVRSADSAVAMTRLALSRLSGSTKSSEQFASIPGEVPSAELLAAVWAGMTVLPESQRTLSGKIIGALRLLEYFRVSGSRRAFDETAIVSQVEQVAGAAPHHCVTCAANGLVSIASSPEYGLSESLQTLEFRDETTVTALLIALDVWLTGQVLYAEEPQTRHKVFADSMASVQRVYEAAELGVQPKQRRNWLARSMGFSELQSAFRQGPVLVHVGGDHFAPVVGIDGQRVTLSDVSWNAEGAAEFREVLIDRSTFDRYWVVDNGRGHALIGVPARVNTIPGRAIPLRQVRELIGCCGIANASSLEGLASKSGMSQDIVRVLESRGFDNFATARKMRIDLPRDFNPADPRYRALSERIERALIAGTEDVLLFKGNDQEPPSLRFFAISRGVGSNTANARVIESDILRRMEEIAQLMYGGGVKLFQVASSGNWEVLRGRRKVGDIKEMAAADHTRFKTKGGDRKENAHHWPWKGVSGGINGDDETFRLVKVILAQDHVEVFEGETDSEVDIHLIGDLQEQKDEQGRVVGHVPSERALIRAIRLLENVEALRQASVVLQPEYAAVDSDHRAEQEAVRTKLASLGIDPDEVARTVKLQGVTIPVFLRAFVNAAIRNPSLMNRLASAENGWKGYYRRLGTQLPQTKEKHFDNPKSLNLSINLLSLYDDHSAVVARTYDKSTEFYFGFGRNEQSGEVEMVLGGSEPRGFASLIGRFDPKDAIEIRLGIVDLVNGSVEQLKAKEWSVYTVDKTRITRHDIWTDEVETGLVGEEMKVRWTRVRPGQESRNAEWTAFKLETTAQPITLFLTVDALTESDESGIQRVHLAEATDRPGPEAEALRAALADPDTKIFAGASGTSYHALLKTDAQYHLFDGLQSSDQWLSGLIRNQILYEISQGHRPIFVIVSQSGTTGAAISLAKELIKLGAIVLGVTNVPGSGIYSTTRAAGGVVVTQSLNETAVAATGSNTSQLAALELIAMKRQEAMAPAHELAGIQRAHNDRIQDLLELTTHVVPGGERHIGVLQGTLDSFNPGQPNQRNVAAMTQWIKQSGLEETFADKKAFRNLNIILTGIGPVAQALAPEIGLKVMEVTRKTAAFIPIQELLANTGRPDGFDPGQAIRSVEENLKRFTTGGEQFIGKYPHFATLGRDDPRLRDASEVLLLGDGESQVTLDYIVARYQTASPVPIKKSLYASAASTVRKGTLVIAVQPWTDEQTNLLEGYRKQEATVVVIATPEAQNLPLHAQAAAKAATEGTLIQTAGDEWRYAHVTVLDLFMMRVMEALQQKVQDAKLKDISTDYTTSAFLAQEVGHLQEQVEGMRQVVDSFNEQRAGGRHRNAISFQRLSRYYKARGWGHFDWWATGKGTRYAAARDLALLAWSRIGKQMGTAEGSEFKHGYSAATNISDNFFNVWSKKGTPDWGDDVKTVIEELVPRVADYPYPVFSDREPGLMTLLAAEDPNDDYLVHLSDAEYDRLRTLRRAAKRAEGETSARPDVVFVTPHGGFLEQLTLNRMLIQGVERSLAEYLSEQNLKREEVLPRTLVLNVDTGEFLPGKQALYDRLRALFPSDRNRIVSISGVNNRQAISHSDQQVVVNGDDPIAFVVVGHQLTTQMVEARFDHVLEWLVELNHAIQKEIKQGTDGTIGRFAPEVTTPGELLTGWARREPGSYRALQEFSRGNPTYGDLETNLLDILDWYNIDAIQAIGAAHDIHELRHSIVDLIAKLAKVVANSSGIRVRNPENREPVVLASATLGEGPLALTFDAAALQGLTSDSSAMVQIRDILAEDQGADKIGRLEDAQVLDLFAQVAQSHFEEAAATVRSGIPRLPQGVRVVLQVHGDRLAHQSDGLVALNIQCCRNTLLLAQQFDHELGHEMLGTVLPGTPLPATLLSNGAPEPALRRALEELAVLRVEASRFFALTPRQQHDILEVLQGPNPVDPSGEFDNLLAQLQRLQPEQWTAPILQFLAATRRDLSFAALAWLRLPAAEMSAVVASIQERTVAVYPEIPLRAGALLEIQVRRLEEHLAQRVRNAQDRTRLLDAYRRAASQRSRQSYWAEEHADDDLIYVIGAQPYQKSADAPEMNVGLMQGIQALEGRLGVQLVPTRLFVTEFSDEVDAPPMVLFQIAFRRSAAVQIDLVREIEQVAAAYLAPVTRPVTPAAAPTELSEQFRAEAAFETEMQKILKFEGLDGRDGIAAQAMETYREFRGSGDPQVFLLPHPSGNPVQSVVVAIDHDRPSLEADVIDHISGAGADYSTSVGRTIGDAGLIILEIKNLGADDQTLIDAVNNLRTALKRPVEQAPAVEPMVGITRLRDQLAEEMHQAFLADPYFGIHFKAVYDPPTNQTVLVVVAQTGQLNLVAAVSSVLTEAGIDLGKKFGPLPDHVGEDAEYFIVPSKVPDAAIGGIQSELSATVTLNFKGAILQVLPLSSMDEISSYFHDFRSASEEGVAFVSRLDEGTSISEQFVFSFAVRGLAETAPRLLQVRQAVQEIFSLNNLTVGDATDFEYRGVRIFHGKVAGFATEEQVRAAEEQIDNALTPFKTAGLEETPVVATLPRILRPASVSVPAAMREIVGSQGGQPAEEIRQEMGIYGSVFVDPAGLAVGVSLQTARLSDGSLAPQRFVVANEAQEQVLLQVLASERQGDIVRGWEHGGVPGAMDYANEQLRAQNLIPQTVRPQNVAAILPELRELMQLLAVTHYDAEFAAKVAQQVYNLFA